MFNLAVEDVAQMAAVSLRAEKLILMGKNPGILDDDGNTVEDLTVQEAKELLPSQKGEPRNHLDAAIKAVSQGVPRAHLLSYEDDGTLLTELFTREGHGSMVTQTPYDQLRPAKLDDINGIIELLQPLEEKGVLVRRSRELLEREIERFYVIERDGLITATAALYPYSNEQAELACVAVDENYRATGRGSQLLEQIEMEAKKRKLKRLFVLTTRTAHWFVEHGFVAGEVSELPAEKQHLYNFQRNSKVFFKTL